MWWHCCFHDEEENRRSLLGRTPPDLESGASSVSAWGCGELVLLSSAGPPPWKLLWCEMGVSMLATAQPLGGCFLSFAFARLVTGGCPLTGFDDKPDAREPISDIVSGMALGLAPKPGRRQIRVATLYVRGTFLTALPNSNLYIIQD